MVYEFDGTKYEKLRDMQAARRAKYLDLVRGDVVAPLSPRRAVCGGHGCTPACRLPVLCYTVTYTAAWGREQVPCIRRPTCRATTAIMAA